MLLLIDINHPLYCLRCTDADDGRFLTAIDKAYYDSLSSASKKSLAFQGGPFEGEELDAFLRDPLRDQMVAMRRWDDAAKVEGIVDETPRAETYSGMIERHLERNED